VFFKTDAERAAAQATRARQDATEAGASAASGARNLGAAFLATLAEVTAPQDDRSGRKHAQKARAKALKAASKDRSSAAKAATKAKGAAGKASKHSRSALEKQSDKAGGRAAALGGMASARAARLADDARAQSAHAAEALRHQRDALRDHGAHAADAVRERAHDAGPLAESAAAKAGAGAAALAGLAAATRDRAVSGVDHGIDAAVPRAQEGVAGVGPAVDHVRDLINEELLPKIQQMLGDVQTGKDRLLAQDEGVVAAVTGAPKAKGRKGGVLITLGLLAAAGAGLAWWLAQQQSQPAADPWASKDKRDPWAASTSTTSTSSVSAAPATTTAAVGGVGSTTTPTEKTMSNDAQDTHGEHGEERVTHDTSAHQTSPTGEHGTDVTRDDRRTADREEGGAVAPSSAGDGSPRMLDTEQIDDLGTDTPSPVAEQGTGESPTEEIEAARSREHHALPHAADEDGEDDTPRRV